MLPNHALVKLDLYLAHISENFNFPNRTLSLPMPYSLQHGLHFKKI